VDQQRGARKTGKASLVSRPRPQQAPKARLAPRLSKRSVVSRSATLAVVRAAQAFSARYIRERPRVIGKPSVTRTATSPTRLSNSLRPIQ
jgi:hypothetical protein